MSQPNNDIFQRLRSILQPHAGSLRVSADSATHFCIDVPYSPKLKKGYPVAWVKVCKNYVSFHLMPVYMFPKLRENMSDQLRARMQGKACFNFNDLDESLLQELDAITRKGLSMGRDAGFAP